MAQRGTGIHVVAGRLCAVELTQDRQETRVSRVAILPIESGIEAIDIEAQRATAVSRLFDGEGFQRDARIALALPSDKTWFGELETQLQKTAQVRQIARYEMERDFPSPPEDVVAEVSSGRRAEGGDKRSFLVSATRRDTLEHTLSLLIHAGVDCSIVETEAGALNAVAITSNPELTADRYVVMTSASDGWLFCVGEAGNLRAGRTLRWLPEDADLAAAIAREVELTWHRVFDGPIPTDAPVLVVTAPNALGDDNLIPPLTVADLGAHLDCHPTALDPNTALGSDERLDPRLTIAYGLALRALGEVGAGMDFREAHLRSSQLWTELRSPLLIAASMLVLIGAVLCTRLFLEVRSLETERARIRSEARAIAERVLPGERIVQPLAQVEARLSEQGRQHEVLGPTASGGDHLRFLHLISTNTPDKIPVDISELAIDGRTARLTGSAAALKWVEDVKSNLETTEELESVVLEGASVDRATRRVDFTLSITRK